jgi:hypothetical protein
MEYQLCGEVYSVFSLTSDQAQGIFSFLFFAVLDRVCDKFACAVELLWELGVSAVESFFLRELPAPI